MKTNQSLGGKCMEQNRRNLTKARVKSRRSEGERDGDETQR